MLCSKYEELTNQERVIFIGELCHSCQSDNRLFELAKNIIEIATLKGLFNGVTILPDEINDHN